MGRIIKKKTPKIFHFTNYTLWIRKFITPRVIYKITKKKIPMVRLHDVVRRRNSETEIQEREVLKQFGKEKEVSCYVSGSV